MAAIAARAGCHDNTVRRWLHRFNAAGIDGLGSQPGAGRKRRITEAQRSAIIALAREGARVAVADIDDSGAAETAAAIGSENGESFYRRTDVGVTSDVSDLISDVVARWGRLDILVNNAGIAVQGSVTEISEEDWDRLMNVNLTGVWRGMHLAIPEMLKTGGGSVINTSSAQSAVGFRGWAGYAATKGGINSLTRQAAVEYAPRGIRVNAILPGTILTPMNERIVADSPDGAAIEEEWLSMHPAGRLGTPEEVAALVVFLGSDESSFITGELIRVDGGLVVKLEQLARKPHVCSVCPGPAQGELPAGAKPSHSSPHQASRGAAVSAGSAPSVVVVGSINEDVVMELSRTVHPGETVLAERMCRSPGGKGANQAVAAAAAGATVAMVGAVGDDAAGERMLDDLRQSEVMTEWVRVVEGTVTGTTYITVTLDGENTIVVGRGANALVDKNTIEAAGAALAGAKVLVSLLEIPTDTVTETVQLSLRTGIRPVVTLAPAQAVPPDLLSGLDPLLVNEHEAAVLLGVPSIGRDIRGAARDLLALGPSSAVVTLGAAGAVVADAAGVRFGAAVPVQQVVDTTGAGDAFAGALAAALADGADLDAAVAAGHRAGAAAVGRPGAR